MKLVRQLKPVTSQCHYHIDRRFKERGISSQSFIIPILDKSKVKSDWQL